MAGAEEAPAGGVESLYPLLYAGRADLDQVLGVGRAAAVAEGEQLAAGRERAGHGPGAGHQPGRVAAERLADHVVVTPSEHIPRIQEAQATGYHLLRELVEA